MSWHIVTYVVTHTYICCNTYFHMFRHNIYTCFGVCWRWCGWYTVKSIFVNWLMWIFVSSYVSPYVTICAIKNVTCAITYVWMCSHICLYVRSHMFVCAVTSAVRSYFWCKETCVWPRPPSIETCLVLLLNLDRLYSTYFVYFRVVQRFSRL